MDAAAGMLARSLGLWTARIEPAIPLAVRTDQRQQSVTQAFHASEARISSFLDSIRNGQPIDNGRPWSLLDMLTLAGCLHCAILSHPPGWVGGSLDSFDPEKREAIEETHEQEVVATIRFLSRLAFQTLDGHFGQGLDVDAEVKGVLALGADGKPRVQIARS